MTGGTSSWRLFMPCVTSPGTRRQSCLWIPHWNIIHSMRIDKSARSWSTLGSPLQFWTRTSEKLTTISGGLLRRQSSLCCNCLRWGCSHTSDNTAVGGRLMLFSLGWKREGYWNWRSFPIASHSRHAQWNRLVGWFGQNQWFCFSLSSLPQSLTFSLSVSSL